MPETNDNDDFHPRDYQISLMEIALEKNTIIYLPTGSGKTYIAVLVLKRLSSALQKSYSQGGKISLILVNTVALVDQHAKCIMKRTVLKVGRYSGEMNVDLWPKTKWYEEFDKYQVIVMTVQILANLVNQGVLDLNKVNLIVFDECHRAVLDQPMRIVCKSFQNLTEPPRVLGLTATLLNGNCKPGKVMEKVEALEVTCHSKVATVDGLDAVVGFSTNPHESIVTAETHTLTSIEGSVMAHIDSLILVLSLVKTAPKAPSVSLILNGLEPLNKDEGLRKLINNIKNIKVLIETLGMYGGSKAILAYMIQIERIRKHCDDVILYKILNYVQMNLGFLREQFENAMKGYSEPKRIVMFSSDKVRKLIGIFDEFREATSVDLCALIFTKRRVTAKVIFYILDGLRKSNPTYAYIKPNYIVGNNATPYKDTRELLFLGKKNREVLQSFENKDCNVLVASNVLEEGVDVSTCSLVVMFEAPEEYRSYIQSKGRARLKSSHYYMIVDDSKIEKFVVNYREFQEVERILYEYLIGANITRAEPSTQAIQEMYNEDEFPPYYVSGPNSAKVDMVSAISLLCQYCQCLPCDKYTTYSPEFFSLNKKSSTGRVKISVVIQLPVISPLREPIQGPFMCNKKTAKRAAALKACKQLHLMGELDDHLLPKRSGVVEEDVGFLFSHYPEVAEKEAGTNKKRRLHKKMIPWYLKGPVTTSAPVYLHIIHLEPLFPREEHLHKSALHDMYTSSLCYGILTPNKLPTLCEFPVFVSLGTINVSLAVNRKQLNLTEKILEDVKLFNLLIYNDVLNCLRDFLIIDNSDEAESMIVVPVNRATADIDLEVLREHKVVKDVVEPSVNEKMQLEVTQESYLRKIVAPWYRDSQNYLVTEVTLSKNAKSEFPNEEFHNYEEYFQDKHGLKILNPMQPLLYVKSLSSRKNCIKPRSSHAKRKREEMLEDLEIHLVPELVVKQDFPAPLWIQANLLPTILSRFSFLFRLEELKSTIAKQARLGHASVPQKKPLEVDVYLLKYSPHMQQKKNPNDVAVEPKQESQVQSTLMPAVNFNKDYSKKMLEREYPWKDIDEPKDLERELDVTIMDIEYYENFVEHPINERDVLLKNEPLGKKNRLALTYEKEYKLKPIKLLQKSNVSEGPELCLLYKAMTTAKANDIVNMERLETLGDSFLKLFASLYIYLRFPSYNEGQATSLKGRLISNKNLYYLGNQISIARITKNNDLQIADWLPPGFRVPNIVTDKIESKEMSLSSLFHLLIPKSEQISGQLSGDTVSCIETVSDDADFFWEDGLISDVASFFKSNYVGDKQVADGVEALIGAYFQCCGVMGGLKLMQWIGIIPPSENFIQMLQQPPNNPILNVNAQVENIDHHLPNWQGIEAVLGYRFKNRGFLLQALTHASYSPNRLTQPYEKLEFLGDAVLDFLITCHIYESCGNLDPGELTDLRSALVNNNTFASLAVRCNFHKNLLMINNKLQSLIDRFADYIESKGYQIDDEVLTLLTEGVDDDSLLNLAEYIDVPKVLGDIFEAIAGAVYLDSNKDLQTVWSVFYRIMSKEIEMFSAKVPRNLVRRLYEWEPNTHPQFQAPQEATKEKVMVPLDFMLNGHRQRVYGFGTNKTLAKKAAAKMALRFLR